MEIGLYGQYPRIVGYPIRQKVIHSIGELNNHIKEFISKAGIHLSLYSFATLVRVDGFLQPDYESAIVDKIFLDLDEGDWLISPVNMKYIL